MKLELEVRRSQKAGFTQQIGDKFALLSMYNLNFKLYNKFH